MIFETHAHYDDEAFEGDRERLLAGLSEQGIGKVINIAASIESAKSSLALAEKYDFVYAAVGVHPSEIDDLNEESMRWLQEQTRHPKTVAIGEIGLDYYWEKDAAAQARQRDWFLRQLDLAREAQLPVVIHSREAAEDTLRILCKVKQPGVVHCYSYSAELAKEYVKLGYYIGVGGVVTFKNAKKLKETVRQIPLERIVVETDCPYLAPEPHRGKRNDSSYLPIIVQQIAEQKGLCPKEVAQVTWDNAMRLFSRVPHTHA